MGKITPVHWRKLVKVFQSLGWKIDGIKGDHIILDEETFTRPIIIPRANDVAISIIMNNLKTAGISRKEYLKLLTQI
jgi:predicted RNA binding protein YcfA (HicA-like mRNA interferase family)